MCINVYCNHIPRPIFNSQFYSSRTSHIMHWQEVVGSGGFIISIVVHVLVPLKGLGILVGYKRSRIDYTFRPSTLPTLRKVYSGHGTSLKWTPLEPGFLFVVARCLQLGFS